MLGGSGKRQLADGSCLRLYAIGKLRRLRLPLPPIARHSRTRDASKSADLLLILGPEFRIWVVSGNSILGDIERS
jgi:hypothetical protein